MVKPLNSQGMTIPLSTYEKLTELKKEGETFDDVVRKLVEMDLKYNPRNEIIEYEFLTYGVSKVFRITFEKNSHFIEYYVHGDEFSSNISAWDNFPKISDEDKELFINFIVNDESILKLKTMGEAIEEEGFIIRKIAAEKL